MKRTLLLILSCLALASYSQFGTLNPAFGNNGVLELQVPPAGSPVNYVSTAIQPDGKFLLTREVFKQVGTDFTITRFNTDGSVDPTFTAQPINTAQADYVHAIAIQPDGKILLAGTASNPNDFSIFVIRLNPNGSLDNSFANNGTLITSFGGEQDVPFTIAIQPDHKILVAGMKFTSQPQTGTMAILRLNANGSPDGSFSGDGLQTVAFDAPGASISIDAASNILLQNDGKIVLVGNVTKHFPSNILVDIAVARLTANGSLDNTFSGDGRQTTDFDGNQDQVGSAVLQPDGKIVVTGYTHLMNATDWSNIILARYNSDGSLDNSFSGDGKQITDLGGNYNSGTFVHILPDAKILVGGMKVTTVYIPDPEDENNQLMENVEDFALLRYNANGTLDNDFFGNGIETTDFATHETNLGMFVLNNQLFVTEATDGTGGPKVIAASFLLTGVAPKPGLTLVNAKTNGDIQELKDGDELDLSKLPRTQFNIKANAMPGIASVVFELSGTQSLKHTENILPYALFGDSKGNYTGKDLPPGDYALTATPYSKVNGKGTKGAPLTVHFKVVYPAAVTRFTLVNAATGGDIQELKEGDVLNLSTLPSVKLNVRATVAPDTVGSVIFTLAGQQVRQLTENLLPYALFGDSADHYRAWTPDPGNYTLTATPYSAARGKGIKGGAYSVNFAVVAGLSFMNSIIRIGKIDEAEHKPVMKLSAYPNPMANQGMVRFSLPKTAFVTLGIYDQRGAEVKRLYQGQAEEGQTYQIELKKQELPKGLYLLRLATGTQTATLKVIMLQ